MQKDINLPCVVIGASGHAGVIVDALRAAGKEPAGLLDPGLAPGTLVFGLPVLGGDDRLDDAAFLQSHAFAIGLGSQRIKAKIALSILERGGCLQTVIHPAAFLAGNTSVGEGTFVAAGAIIATGARIGRFAIINTGCSVDHDGVLADGVQVCPGARLAGNVKCGYNVFIGTNATVLPQVSIGDEAVIGGGTVVIRDVPAAVTMVGNPARQVKPGPLAPPR